MNTERIRVQIRIDGQVQGVGFRPAVYRWACSCKVCGWVGNDSKGVFIEAEADRNSVQRFLDGLPEAVPPHARINHLEVQPMPPRGDTEFRIITSRQGDQCKMVIPPDLALCRDCRRELLNPNDRRYEYPFINCINCGPRYSIIQGIPYDRPQTTMRTFIMCEACRAEYENPQDRRFHAQPNACAQCGPQVVWETGGKQRERGIKAIREAAGVLRQGGIVAVKGLGGFHLACRADDAAAVARLRERKGREAKPFALMVEDLATARSVVAVDETSASLLTGWRAPILLLPRLESSMVAPNVAPGMPRLGVMLAYTPLHVLLLRELPGIPMIMTSANPSEEPLCKDNDEARARMAEIADGFLMHNRDIARRVDDSVVLYDEQRKSEIAVRRSRGYVPQPFYLSSRQRISQDGILAFGGDLKAVLAIAHDDQLVLSEHLGDLENPQALRNYLTTLELFKAIVDIDPKWGGCDLHPGYFSTREARRIFRQREGQLIGIQHHHAHVEAVRVEYALEGPLLGLAVDGTGYGLDKTIWGGEILLSTGPQFERPGHLHPFYLPGGDQSAREVWRTGISLLVEAGVSHDDIVQCVRQRGGEDYQAEILLGLLAKKRGGVFCSSLGRLFDGAGWLILGLTRNRFEAEVPMSLEAAALTWPDRIPMEEDVTGDGTSETLDWRPLLRRLLADLKAGRPPEYCAAWFHHHIAWLFARRIQVLAEATGIEQVALSGGCMLNSLFRKTLVDFLEKEGLSLYIGREIPPGDGGLAAGQAAIVNETICQIEGITESCALQYPVVF